MRTEKYMEIEQKINAAGWEWRRKFGEALLADPAACHPGGRLKQGVIEQLLAAAEVLGFALSEREIQYRLQAAKEFSRETENTHHGADFHPEVKTETLEFPVAACGVAWAENAAGRVVEEGDERCLK